MKMLKFYRTIIKKDIFKKVVQNSLLNICYLKNKLFVSSLQIKLILEFKQ